VSSVIFHGTALPDREWAAGLHADVVLQPYHPIVQAQEYASWFPHARRFVYVNPTVVDPLRRSDATAEMVFHDPHDGWDLPRLRLPLWLDWAVADAVAIAGGSGVHGLFVDDLDRLLDTPAGRETAVRYVRAVTAASGAGIYVNRAFAVLDALPAVEAVLLEDLDVDLASPGTAAWLYDVVLPALQRARDRGVRIHQLGYGTATSGPGTSGQGGATPLGGVATSSNARLPDPRLDQWSWWDAEAAPAAADISA
jgi:hypothetical protein